MEQPKTDNVNRLEQLPKTNNGKMKEMAKKIEIGP